MPKIQVGEAVLQAKIFAETLPDMTDDEVIDAWADVKRYEPKDGERDEYLLKRKSAEAEAVNRFGLGEHMKRLHAKHPDLA